VKTIVNKTGRAREALVENAIAREPSSFRKFENLEHLHLLDVSLGGLISAFIGFPTS
jgi:hypothetical protein